MPDTKISALTDGSPAQSGDEIPAARSGANVRITAGDIAALATGTPSDFQPAIVTNNYYSSQILSVGATVTPAVDTIFVHPIWFSHAETWTRLLVNITTGSGAAPVRNVRLGIWDSTAGFMPGNLLVDTGSLSIENSGEVSATIAELLSANTLYWVGALTDDAAGAASFTGGAPGRLISSLTGVGSIGYAAFSAVAYMKTHAYGALPDPFGTPDDVSQDCPMIWLRKV